jgi:hypothetical protein
VSLAPGGGPGVARRIIPVPQTMDRFQPSTQNPHVPPPVNLDLADDGGNRAPDHEPIVGGDDAQLPIPGTDKPQVAPDPQGVKDAERKGLGMPSSKSEDAGA